MFNTRNAYEVNTDCGHKVVCENVVSESEKERGLSDSGVSNKQDLEEIVAITVSNLG